MSNLISESKFNEILFRMVGEPHYAAFEYAVLELGIDPYLAERACKTYIDNLTKQGYDTTRITDEVIITTLLSVKE